MHSFWFTSAPSVIHPLVLSVGAGKKKMEIAYAARVPAAGAWLLMTLALLPCPERSPLIGGSR